MTSNRSSSTRSFTPVQRVARQRFLRRGQDAGGRRGQAEARVQAGATEPPGPASAGGGGTLGCCEPLAHGDVPIDDLRAQAASEERVGLDLGGDRGEGALDRLGREAWGRAERPIEEAHRALPSARWRRSASMARNVSPRTVPARRPMTRAASSAESPAA